MLHCSFILLLCRTNGKFFERVIQTLIIVVHDDLCTSVYAVAEIVPCVSYLYCVTFNTTVYNATEIVSKSILAVCLVLYSNGVHCTVWCDYWLFLIPHFAIWFVKTIIVSYFIFTVTCVMRYNTVYSLVKIITASYLIFVVIYAMQCIKCGLKSLKSVYFLNFGFFLSNPKLFFPFVLGQVLNY